MTKVRYGWLIRSIHSWSANLMILTAFLHMFSVLFLKAYRKPREITWMSEGMLLLFLVMGLGFSGYLLPWNTLAFFATKVGTEIRAGPDRRQAMMIFLRGGPQVTGATLSRFFGFHVAVLPGLVTVLSRSTCCWSNVLASAFLPKSNWSGLESLGKAGNEILSQLYAAGDDGLVRGAWRAGRVGSDLPVEPRCQGRSVGAAPAGIKARVVLPLHVPDAEAHPFQSVVHGRRRPGCAWVRPGGLVVASPAIF